MNDRMSPIEERLKRYYKQQSLPLDVLLDCEQTIDETQVELSPGWRWISVRMNPIAKLVATAAVILACIGLTTYLVRQEADIDQWETVAAEIALNHAKQFDSEFFTTSIPGLVHSMPLLDFAPVQPKRMALGKYDIQGARYCTIDHSIAVQVRLIDEARSTYTLYEFRTLEPLPLEDEKVLILDGIQVTLWQEGDVTMGLAQHVEEF